MPDDPISSTGKWLTPDGKVVDKEPVEGRLLVAAGTPVTPDMRAAVERAEAAAPAVETTDDNKAREAAAVVEDVETTTVPPARETAQVGPERKRRV